MGVQSDWHWRLERHALLGKADASSTGGSGDEDCDGARHGLGSGLRDAESDRLCGEADEVGERLTQCCDSLSACINRLMPSTSRLRLSPSIGYGRAKNHLRWATGFWILAPSALLRN